MNVKQVARLVWQSLSALWLIAFGCYVWVDNSYLVFLELSLYMNENIDL